VGGGEGHMRNSIEKRGMRVGERGKERREGKRREREREERGKKKREGKGIERERGDPETAGLDQRPAIEAKETY